MVVATNMLMENVSSESVNVTSPLTPLRMSSTTRRTEPRKSGSKSKKPPRDSRKKERQEFQKCHQDPGFDFDYELPTTSLSEDTEDSEKIPIMTSRVSRLASVLLTSGKVINSKFNVVDALGNGESKGSGSEQIHISRATRNRTEAVKAMIAVKYHWMERSIEPADESETNNHPGVQGVYNPLQVIRNRAIRAKHHEPAPISFRSLPLAVNVFSVRNRTNHKHKEAWKLIWGIELGELMSDVSWRTSHWHELRKHNGELWFPDSNSNSVKSGGSVATGSSSLTNTGRMHDALFKDPSNENSLDDINLNLIPIESARPPKLLRSNLKSKAKRLYGNSTGGVLTSDSDVAELAYSDPHSKSVDNLSKVRIARLVRRTSDNTERKLSNGEELEIQISHTLTPSRRVSLSSHEMLHQAPRIVINNFEQEEDLSKLVDLEDTTAEVEELPKHLQDVVFNPMDKRNDKELVENVSQEPIRLSESKEPEIFVDLEGPRVNFLGEKQEYLDRMIFLNYNYLTNVYPASMEIITKNADKILQQQFGLIFRDIINVNDSQLPRYEDYYTGYVNESKSLIQMANNNYAVRIDNLLSATDRSIGEINTSLSMDLRKVSETLDRLNWSIFGNSVLNEFKAQRNKFENGSNYRMLYTVLENTIVIVLRLIWIVVNIYKAIFFVLKILWRIVRMFI